MILTLVTYVLLQKLTWQSSCLVYSRVEAYRTRTCLLGKGWLSCADLLARQSTLLCTSGPM